MVGDKLVVFDVDGVLVDSRPVNVLAFQHAFIQMGLEVPSDEAVRRLIGRSALDMLRALGCPPGLEEDAFVRYVRPCYLEHFAALACRYEGTLETLHELSERGYLLAACTSGTWDVQEPALRSLGLIDFFSRMQTACRTRLRKPHPAYLGELLAAYGQLQEVWHVEDTEDGVRMGLANQAITVFAEYGYGRCQAVRPHYRTRKMPDLLSRMDSYHRSTRRRRVPVAAATPY